MDETLFACGTALWLGVLTSISPCPLTSNIAAISFIGRKLHEPRKVFAAGLLYTAGRTFTYLTLGMILASSALSAIDLSRVLQGVVYKLLGPTLILVGMLLLGLFRFTATPPAWIDALGRRAATHGVWGAFILGVLFATAFCPVSGALFFGTLVPLAVKRQEVFSLPALYGIGTALPVCLFAGLIAFGARKVASTFERFSDFEKWARWLTGGIFIIAGVIETLRSVFGLL